MRFWSIGWLGRVLVGWDVEAVSGRVSGRLELELECAYILDFSCRSEAVGVQGEESACNWFGLVLICSY